MLLEKGMVIYGDNFGLSKYVIDRVTEKQAVAKVNEGCEIRFDRDIADKNWFHAKGGNEGYRRTSYSIETPEIIKKYKRQTMLSKFSKINGEKLTDEQLEAILGIIRGVYGN